MIGRKGAQLASRGFGLVPSRAQPGGREAVELRSLVGCRSMSTNVSEGLSRGNYVGQAVGSLREIGMRDAAGRPDRQFRLDKASHG